MTIEWVALRTTGLFLVSCFLFPTTSSELIDTGIGHYLEPSQ